MCVRKGVIISRRPSDIVTVAYLFLCQTEQKQNNTKNNSEKRSGVTAVASAVVAAVVVAPETCGKQQKKTINKLKAQHNRSEPEREKEKLCKSGAS